MSKYKTEVKTVMRGDLVVGYMCRSHVVYGMAQEIPITWCVTKSLTRPRWIAGFRTRKQARMFLYGEA